MQNCKRLPLNATPPVRAYLAHAYLFSILSEAHLPWLLGGSYTQLVWDHDPDWMPLDFFAPAGYSEPPFACPLIDSQWICRSLVEKAFQNVCEFFVQAIEDGFYAICKVDEFYVPRRACFQRQHFVHSLLIFGYDYSEQCFDVIGYTETGAYTATQIGFSQFRDAFSFGKLEDDEETQNDPHIERHFNGTGTAGNLRSLVYSEGLRQRGLNRVSLCRLNSEVRYCFDICSVSAMLTDLQSSADSSRRFKSTFAFPNKPYSLGQPVPEAEQNVFGLETYRCLQEWMELIADGEKEFGIIPVHLLWEHKCVVVAQLEYMEQNGHIDPSMQLSSVYREIEARVGNLRLAMVKYGLTGSAGLLRRSTQRLDPIRRDEEELLARITQAIA